MVGPEGTAILPLREGCPAPVVDCEPAPLEHCFSLFLKAVPKPWNHTLGLGLGVAAGDIAVGKGDVERILPGSESDRDVVAAVARIGIVVASVVESPFGIPGTAVVRHGVPGGRALPDPEDRGHDVAMPGILSKTDHGSRGGTYRRGSGLLDGPLPDLHRHPLKITRCHGSGITRNPRLYRVNHVRKRSLRRPDEGQKHRQAGKKGSPGKNHQAYTLGQDEVGARGNTPSKTSLIDADPGVVTASPSGYARHAVTGQVR